MSSSGASFDQPLQLGPAAAAVRAGVESFAQRRAGCQTVVRIALMMVLQPLP